VTPYKPSTRKSKHPSPLSNILYNIIIY